MSSDRRGTAWKWAAYTIAFLITYFFSAGIFSHFPIFGVVPVIIPAVCALVGTFEGSLPGSIFGTALGLFACLAETGTGASMILIGMAAGTLSGVLQEKRLRHPMLSRLGCALCALCAAELVRIAGIVLFGSAQWQTLLRIAGGEVLYSFALTIPAYALFRFVGEKLTVGQ